MKTIIQHRLACPQCKAILKRNAQHEAYPTEKFVCQQCGYKFTPLDTVNDIAEGSELEEQILDIVANELDKKLHR